MKGVWVACAVGVVQVFLLVGTAHAAGDSFVDDFLTFDDTRRTKEDHMPGRSYLNPANVAVADRNARFKIPARTLQDRAPLQRALPPWELLLADEASRGALPDNRIFPLLRP